MTNKREGRKKPFLVILEGAHGAGKGTISTAIRNRITCTNLISLSGLPIDSSKELVFNTRASELDMLFDIRKSKLNIVMDRSFMSDRVFQILGKKPYSAHDFDTFYNSLINKLEKLKQFYNIKLVMLSADKEEYIRRHKARANKPQYENLELTAEHSMIQQGIYLDVMCEVSAKAHIDFININTGAPKERTINKVLEFIEG